jgi:hypothetical protein
MTGEKRMFSSYVKNKDPQDSIIFGDGNQGKVKGLGKIAISSEHSISNVFLVESLGYNLLSVSRPGREACATSAQEQGPLPLRAPKIIVSDNLINTNFSND